MPSTKFEGSARARLLAAANELFYEEGVHTVGIDRLIEHAGVAKASLYTTFGSKEELVREYLRARAETRHRRMSERIARHDNPRDRILSLFDLLGELVREPTFRGCAFVNASAEGPRGEGKGESKIAQVCNESRAWVLGLFTSLAGDCHATDPQRLGRQLALVYEGAVVAASMDRHPAAAHEARALAELLIDAHAPAGDAAGKRSGGTAKRRARRRP